MRPWVPSFRTKHLQKLNADARRRYDLMQKVRDEVGRLHGRFGNLLGLDAPAFLAFDDDLRSRVAKDLTPHLLGQGDARPTPVLTRDQQLELHVAVALVMRDLWNMVRIEINPQYMRLLFETVALERQHAELMKELGAALQSDRPR